MVKGAALPPPLPYGGQVDQYPWCVEGEAKRGCVCVCVAPVQRHGGGDVACGGSQETWKKSITISCPEVDGREEGGKEEREAERGCGGLRGGARKGEVAGGWAGWGGVVRCGASLLVRVPSIPSSLPLLLLPAGGGERRRGKETVRKHTNSAPLSPTHTSPSPLHPFPPPIFRLTSPCPPPCAS